MDLDETIGKLERILELKKEIALLEDCQIWYPCGYPTITYTTGSSIKK